MRPFVFSLTLGSLLLPVFSQEPPSAQKEAKTAGVDLALISEVSSIAPATPFTVAFSIHHHAGFHTYWKNPGIVGVPFSITWDLPEGFSTGEIQWPVPEQIDMAGHPAHGQTRDVLLLVEITPPQAFDGQTGQPITLSASANWMACADGCHPGNKSFSLTLPVAAKATPSEHATAVQAARNQLPRPLEGWAVTLESQKDAPEIRVQFRRNDETSAEPGDVYFYSSDGQISSFPAQTIEPFPGGFRIIAPRAEYSPKNRSTLPGVLVAEKPWGSGQGRAVTVEPAYR